MSVAAIDFALDDEFRTLLPPLGPDELASLRDMIEDHGCLHPLVVWDSDGERVLIDGYHRLSICQDLSVPFATIEMQFKSRSHAILWVFRNQTGRRNLTAQQIAYHRGRVVLTRSEEVGVTAAAKEAGVSRQQAYRDASFAQAVDELPPETKTTLMGVGKKTAAAARKAGDGLTPKARAAAIEEVLSGDDCPLQDAATSPGLDRMERENRDIESWCRKVKAVAKELPNLSHWTPSHEGMFADRLDSFLSTVKSCRGRSLCAFCVGDGSTKGKWCDHCRGSGFSLNAG